LRQLEKTTDFQENTCRLSQILKSSLPEKVCPLMKETIRMTSCGPRSSFSCGWFLSCMPKPAIYFSRCPLTSQRGMLELSVETNNREVIRIRSLSDQGTENDLQNTTAAERIAMMWPLALDAWAFKGEPVRESRLPRHVIRVVRRGS